MNYKSYKFIAFSKQIRGVFKVQIHLSYLFLWNYNYLYSNCRKLVENNDPTFLWHEKDQPFTTSFEGVTYCKWIRICHYQVLTCWWTRHYKWGWVRIQSLSQMAPNRLLHLLPSSLNRFLILQLYLKEAEIYIRSDIQGEPNSGEITCQKENV